MLTRNGAFFVLTVLAVFLCSLLSGCASSSLPQTEVAQQRADSSLGELLDEIQAWEESRSPLSLLYAGSHTKTIRPLGFDDLRQQSDQAQIFLERLAAIDDAGLSRQETLSKQVMRFKLTDFADRLRFGAHLTPINAEGGFYNGLNFLIGRLPFNTEADYNAFLAWLPDYANYVLSHIPSLEKGMQQGQIAPVPVVNNTISMLAGLKSLSFEEHPAMQPFAELPPALTAETKTTLLKKGEAVFANSLQPAYATLHEFFTNTYASKAPEMPGLVGQPGGSEYYANRVEFFTTLSLTPDDVFSLGEREVARISAAMDKVRTELNDANGTQFGQAQLIAELRQAPEHYPTSGQALLERAAWIAKRIEGQLPQWFNPLYQLPFTIEPVPADIAPTYTSGRYLSGDRDQDRPGVYWVNTTRLKSRALFNLPALTLHEAVPGHHLQHARTSELTDVHPFRNKYYISAFGEGWGLYAEYLGEEMGIYENAYEQFGRLSYEMWRACRLVVDVGIHDRGWSRAQAIDYLGSRTALSEHEVITEIDRYIGWPGQALAYKLGELTIIGLRREAEQELGANFDVKAFHDAVLANGALPLKLLIDQVRLQLGLSGTGLPASLRSN